MIPGELVECLALEVGKHFRIFTLDPSRRGHVNGVELALDLVFIAQSVGDHVELQRSHGAEDQIIAAQWSEQLRGALLAKLRQSFLQCLQA